MNEERRAKLEKMKRRLKEAGITTRRKFVKLICSKCKREFPIRTEDKNRYTEESVKSWICPICK